MVKKIIQKYGIYLGFVFIFAVFSLLSPHFLRSKNISNILVQSSIMAIIAIGETIVIISGGIELSVGSVVAFTSLFSAVMIVKSGFPIAVGVILAILGSGVIGLFNGILISYGRIPPFITTLGMMSIARGASLALNGGKPLANMPSGYEQLATYNLFNTIPIFIVYTAIAYIIAYFFLVRLKPGRYIYAIGGNRDSARLSGIKVKRYETLSYVICGLLAGVGGVMLTARLDYATPLAGMGYELDVIAATVIGGTSLAGGVGNIFGTLLGAVMIITLRNGLTLLNVFSYYQQIVIGVVIIAAVFLDTFKISRET